VICNRSGRTERHSRHCQTHVLPPPNGTLLSLAAHGIPAAESNVCVLNRAMNAAGSCLSSATRHWWLVASDRSRLTVRCHSLRLARVCVSVSVCVCVCVCVCVSAYDCCSRSLSSGINSLLSAVLLQMAPTIFELALVCSVLVCSRVRSRFSTSTLTDCAANRHTTAAPTTLPSPSPPSEHTPPSRWLSRNGGANQLHSTRQSQSALSV